MKQKQGSQDRNLSCLGQMTRVLKLTVFLLFVLFFQLSAEDGDANSFSQQAKTVSGLVTDDQGEPLPGATVVVKGTTQGTITNMDGQYSLSDVPGESTLLFSFVGMKTQEVLVGNQTVINMQMEPDAIGLQEVIAIGYGTTTKRKSVGAISTINAEKLEQTPFPNVSQALQGQVPGLIIQNSGGGLGSTPSISIRGAGTPLYVIDGVISDEFAFTTLNSEDIENMSFLKDASATAVYGSKAGNGIVLVQTKKGTEGAPVVKYSTNLQLSQPTMLIDRVGTREYAEMANELLLRETGTPYYTDEQMALIGVDPQYPDNDWVDLVFKDFAFQQKHNVSVSGGGEKTNYYVSLGYLDLEGNLESGASYMDRTTFRSNVTSKIEKIDLEVSTSLNASIQNNREPESGSFYQIFYNMRPDVEGFNPDGTLAAGNLNPLVGFDRNSGYQRDRKKYLDAQMRLTWKPRWVEGLTVGGMANYKDNDYFYKTWVAAAQQYYLDGTTYPSNVTPKLDIETGYGKTMDLEGRLSYLKTFGKHTIDATYVYTQRTGFSQSVDAGRKNYVSTAVDQLFAGPADGISNDGSAAESASMGHVGRLKYDYDSKYILELSGRYDGNDNFSEDERWGFFPAVSGVWMISDEPFMQPLVDSNILTSLKLRASYGETGISTGVTRFGYMQVYNQGSLANFYNVNDALQTVYSEGNLVDPSQLTWYTRKSRNVGFDFALFRNKLEGSVDYFYYETSGYLMSPKNVYSGTLGKDLPEISSDSKNRRAGYEVSLRYKEKVGKLYYEIGANMSYFDQLWEQLDSEDLATLKNPYVRITHEKDYFGSGEQDGSFDAAMYLNDGLFQSSDEILNSARPLSSAETSRGDIKYVDANGDGKIDASDKRRVGKPTLPHFNYGIDFKVAYEGWTFSGLVQGTGDRYIQLGSQYQKSSYAQKITQDQLNFWREDNTDARFPRISTTDVNGGNNQMYSDFFMENAKYIRLKNLTLSYDLKKKLLKNFDFISGCNISLIGTNLLTFSDVFDYMDPEAKMLNPDVVGNANTVSGTSYPIQRTYSFGLNVQF